MNRSYSENTLKRTDTSCGPHFLFRPSFSGSSEGPSWKCKGPSSLVTVKYTGSIQATSVRNVPDLPDSRHASKSLSCFTCFSKLRHACERHFVCTQMPFPLFFEGAQRSISTSPALHAMPLAMPFTSPPGTWQSACRPRSAAYSAADLPSSGTPLSHPRSLPRVSGSSALQSGWAAIASKDLGRQVEEQSSTRCSSQMAKGCYL